jgi:hypothetical protein
MAAEIDLPDDIFISAFRRPVCPRKRASRMEVSEYIPFPAVDNPRPNPHLIGKE